MRVSAYQNKTRRVSNPPTGLPGFYFCRSRDWQAVFRTEASLAAALDCLGWANWARRRLKAFSHYTFALDDRQKSLSDSNPPTSTKKCWIKAVLRQGHWQTRLAVSLSLSSLNQSSDLTAGDGFAAHYWIQRSAPVQWIRPLSKVPYRIWPRTSLWPSQTSLQAQSRSRHTVLRHTGPPVLFWFIYFVGQWNHDSGQSIVR